MSEAFSELWVCGEPPPLPLPPRVLVLSFAAPGAEAALEEACGPRIVSGRALIPEIRREARAEYVQLVARLGSTPGAGGRTLRQALQGPLGYSRWWLLDITEKDCLWDDDPIYVTMLRLAAVRAVMEQYRITRVRAHGADPDLASALGERRDGARGLVGDLAWAVAAGAIGRARLVASSLAVWWALRRLPAAASSAPDVLLQGYWDWSVGEDAGGRLGDWYFTDLPAQLARRGVRVGWLTSCEPHAEPWQQGRSVRDVLAASCRHPEVTLLERYLSPGDVIRTALNLRYPAQATRFVLDRRLRRLCRVGAFDVYPLVRRRLLRAAWGATFCRLQTVAAAAARACQRLQPRMVIASLELFVRSRALYAGARAASAAIRTWAAQHAGYSSDKTLGALEPEIELRGAPDGCPVPAPDGIFVLGTVSRRMWEASGFAPDRLPVTGGLRYQAVRVTPRSPRPPGAATILLAGGMHEAAHLDLCDAVVAAADGLSGVRIAWRDHPKYRFSERRAFRRYRGAVHVTSGTLGEDLDAADLVLFTQTGIAEEALLRGIPAWQWLWPGFNTSPFVDVPVIPSFTSVSTLRRELEAFLRDPAPYQPSVATQRRVLEECFGPDPAGASARIADAVAQMTAAKAAVSA